MHAGSAIPTPPRCKEPHLVCRLYSAASTTDLPTWKSTLNNNSKLLNTYLDCMFSFNCCSFDYGRRCMETNLDGTSCSL